MSYYILFKFPCCDYPLKMRVNNEPELTENKFTNKAKSHETTIDYIQPDIQINIAISNDLTLHIEQKIVFISVY